MCFYLLHIYTRLPSCHDPSSAEAVHAVAAGVEVDGGVFGLQGLQVLLQLPAEGLFGQAFDGMAGH